MFRVGKEERIFYRYKCDECGKEFVSDVDAIEKSSFLRQHVKECGCNHIFSGWESSGNIGTWPETEYIYTRCCKLCGKKENLEDGKAI